jgi:hypothetical protein
MHVVSEAAWKHGINSNVSEVYMDAIVLHKEEAGDLCSINAEVVGRR